MKTYTVLLLRPDYVADEFGKDTYMAHVVAPNVIRAETSAQWEAAEADFVEAEYTFEEMIEQGSIDLADYAVLCVIEGHHMDIKTA